MERPGVDGQPERRGDVRAERQLAVIGEQAGRAALQGRDRALGAIRELQASGEMPTG